jgi:squalene cyclase
LEEDFSEFEKLEFLDDNEAWIDFVCTCRNGDDVYKRYDNALESTYKQLLEKEIIAHLAEVKQLELREAMDIYYKSKLERQIDDGLFGIQYLDAKYLAEDLLDNEPELFD